MAADTAASRPKDDSKLPPILAASAHEVTTRIYIINQFTGLIVEKYPCSFLLTLTTIKTVVFVVTSDV